MKKNFLFLLVALIFPFVATSEINVDILGAGQMSGKPSFRAGVGVEIPVADNLSLDPGLYYSMRHRQDEEKLETINSSGEVRKTTSCELKAIANYLQLPIYVSYNIPTREDDLQKVMFGPYFAYCIGGDTNITQRFNGAETSSMTSASYPTVLDSRFDFGLAVEYRYVLKSHFVFGIFAEMGLKKIFTSIEVLRDNDNWPVETSHMNPGTKTNQVAGISIGYRF